MRFAELDDRAKERARDKLREWQCQDSWWEYVYEDATQCAKCLGINIGLRGYATVGNKRREEPDISFQASCSQGDGCCFGGWFEIADMAGAVERIKEHAPKDEVLAALAAEAERLYGLIVTDRVRRRTLDLEDVLGGRITISGKDRYFTTKVDDDELETELPEVAKDMSKLASDFADWIHKQLIAESDYQNSNEVIDELAAHYDFDEYGEM